MADSRHIALACCSDNLELAESIIKDLAHAQYTITPVQCHLPGSSLTEALSSYKSKIILLITDNLLKSSDCLDGLLVKVQELISSDLLIPLVADGRIQKANGSGWDAVPTSFDKVSNVLKYMNFWHDRYLELRIKMRHQPEDKSLEHEVEITRIISGEVGEMLRLLRSQRCYTFAEFRVNGYDLFFDIMADKEGKEMLHSTIGPLNKPHSDKRIERSLVEIIEDSSEELMAENLELDAPSFHPLDEKVELDEFTADKLDEIPDLDFLNSLNQQDEDDDEAAEVVKEELVAERPLPSPKAKELYPREKSDSFLDDLPELSRSSFDAIDELLDELINEEEEEEVDLILDDQGDDETDYTDDFDDLFEEDIQSADAPQKKVLSSLKDDIDYKVRYPSAEDALEVGIKLFEAGHMEQAIGFLQGAVEGRPDDISLRYYYAYALARYTQQYDVASKELKILLKLNPDHVDSWFLLAELAEVQKDFEKALDCFATVAKLKPDYPDIYYRLGLMHMLHLEDGEEDAVDYFEMALQDDPKNVDARYRLAVLQSELLNEPEKAVLNFRKVLKQCPEHEFANYDLAILYHSLDEMELARDFYLKAIQINPELKTDHNESVFNVIKHNATGHSDTPDEIKVIIVDESDTSEETKDSSEPTSSAASLSKDDIKTETRIMSDKQKNDTKTTKTVLITGATAGIGLATSRVFAENGYRLIVTGRRAERLDALKSELNKLYKTEVYTLNFDVRDNAAVQEAIDSLPGEWKQVDILINNAGLSRGLAPIYSGDTEHWDTMIDTNIKGLLYLTRAITPQMVERGSGHVINVASSAGKEVYPNGNVYCATKFAVDALTQAMRLDLYQHKIRVSQVAPGHVEKTEFARVRFDWDQERAAKVYEGFQPLKSSDVAEALLFIASRPDHVNIQDLLMFGTQQACNNFIDRSGRP